MAYQPATAAEIAVSEAQFAVEAAEHEVYRAGIARPVSLQLRKDAEQKLNEAKLSLELAEGELYREGIAKKDGPAPVAEVVKRKPAEPIIEEELNDNCFFELIVRTDPYNSEDDRAYSEEAALEWLNDYKFTTDTFREEGRVYPFAEVLLTYVDKDGSGLSSINVADKTGLGKKRVEKLTKSVREYIRQTIAEEVAPLESAGVVAEPVVEYITLNVPEGHFAATWNGERRKIEAVLGTGTVRVDLNGSPAYFTPEEFTYRSNDPEVEAGFWKYEIEAKGDENVTGFITVDSIEAGKKHVEEYAAQSAIRCGEKLTGRAWLLRLNDVEVSFTVSTTLQPKPKSELHDVEFTPEHRAKQGDIVRGPKILYKLTRRDFDPKNHPGTLGAFRSAKALSDYLKSSNLWDDADLASRYLFRITVSEYEVGAEGDNLKGFANYWKQHVTDVRRDPYSASLLSDLCQQS